MKICTNCYKKLYYKMFTPYDIVVCKETKMYISTCCNVGVLEIDGRRYKKTIVELEEKKNLQKWST